MPCFLSSTGCSMMTRRSRLWRRQSVSASSTRKTIRITNTNHAAENHSKVLDPTWPTTDITWPVTWLRTLSISRRQPTRTHNRWCTGRCTTVTTHRRVWTDSVGSLLEDLQHHQAHQDPASSISVLSTTAHNMEATSAWRQLPVLVCLNCLSQCLNSPRLVLGV